MSWSDAIFYPHRVRVRDALPATGAGERFADPRELAAEVKDLRQLVRDVAGNEVVSSSTVTVKLAADVPPGSLVTVWPGSSAEREAKVIAVGRDENPPPLDSFLTLSLE